MFCAVEMMLSALRCSSVIRLSVEMSMPSGRSHPERRSTRAGALSTSCVKPVMIAGMINASSRRPTRNNRSMISPVARPRRHPRFTNHCTAGSSANDRNSAITIVVRKPDSSCASQRIARTVSAAATRTRNSRWPPCLRASGSQSGVVRGSLLDGASLTARGYPGVRGDSRT